MDFEERRELLDSADLEEVVRRIVREEIRAAFAAMEKPEYQAYLLSGGEPEDMGDMIHYHISKAAADAVYRIAWEG